MLRIEIDKWMLSNKRVPVKPYGTKRQHEITFINPSMQIFFVSFIAFVEDNLDNIFFQDKVNYIIY